MPIQRFEPHPLVRGGQLQTLVGHFVTQANGPERYDQILVDLPDGDQLQLHVDRPAKEASAVGSEPAARTETSSDDPTKPVVLLLHGLGGCSESRYILRIASKLNAHGYTAVRFNHRGCGRGGLPLAKNIYHAGRTEDIRASLAALHQSFADRNILLVSFSLSANMTLLLLGKEPEIASELPHFRGALTICPPVDLAACAEALAQPYNRHIDRYYTRMLISTAEDRSRIHPHVARPEFPKKMNLRRFDELYTTLQGGFASVGEYYDQCSSKEVLHRITVPTTIIAASDDPIIPESALAAAKVSPAVDIHVQKGGGHMGFIARKKTSFGDFRWMDEAVFKWIRHIEATK